MPSPVPSIQVHLQDLLDVTPGAAEMIREQIGTQRLHAVIGDQECRDRYTDSLFVGGSAAIRLILEPVEIDDDVDQDGRSQGTATLRPTNVSILIELER